VARLGEEAGWDGLLSGITWSGTTGLGQWLRGASHPCPARSVRHGTQVPQAATSPCPSPSMLSRRTSGPLPAASWRAVCTIRMPPDQDDLCVISW